MARLQIDTKGKTETFFTRNVRLITFLICVTVILSPFVITYIQDVIEEKRMEKRPSMTVEELVFVAERGKDLRQRDLAKFEGYCTRTEMQGMKYAMYRIPILHERNIVLSISIDASMDYAFYVTLIDMDTRAEIDLLKEAYRLEDFLSISQN